MKLWLIPCLALPLAAQALIERAVLTGASTPGAAASAKSAGQSASQALGKAAGVLGAAAATGNTGSAAASPSTSRPASRVSGRAAHTAAAPVVEAPKLPPTLAADLIAQGMTRDEVIAKAGQPLSKLSMPDGAKLVERLRWEAADGSALRAVLEDGKVTELQHQPGAAKTAQP